ncbi:MAG: hypothetical protein H7Y88_06050 [Phycisphaerales bacterium]|nr:hypothetical protein [Phycisphaerales bacterium]
MPSASFHPDLSAALQETLVMLRAQVNDAALVPAERRLAANSIIRLVAVAARFQGGTGSGGTGLQTGVPAPAGSAPDASGVPPARRQASSVLNSVGRSGSPPSGSPSSCRSSANPDFAYELGPCLPGGPPLRSGFPSPASSSPPFTPNSPRESRKGGAGGEPAGFPPAQQTFDIPLHLSAKGETGTVSPAHPTISAQTARAVETSPTPAPAAPHARPLSPPSLLMNPRAPELIEFHWLDMVLSGGVRCTPEEHIRFTRRHRELTARYPQSDRDASAPLPGEHRPCAYRGTG